MHNTLELLFGSRTRANLLGWFFGHTEETGNARQLAEVLQEDAADLGREMALLEEAEILRSSRKGTLKHYRANTSCPFYQELKGLVLKTAGAAGQLRSALRALDGVSYALVYGPYAEGEEEAHSDIEVMIIGDIDLPRLDILMEELEKNLGRTIHYVVYEPQEFAAKKQAKNGFIMEVLQGQTIMLAGDRDALSAA
ncbi:MAG: DNA polymerase beta domain-containing [Geobacteraceae bacterium]|nr:MAG: DNA polymerase beta domain-containing [Geobacteraceae bacterium]